MARLDQARIVEAALELLRDEGLSGITTRKVAAKLGIKSSSLYWYIRDREHLLELLSDRIVAGVQWPRESAAWREKVERMMREYLRCLQAYPDAARVVAGRAPSGPIRLRGAETLLTTLVHAGLPDRAAIDAGLVLTTFVVGFALELEAGQAAAGTETQLDAAFRTTYPMLTRLANQVRPGSASARFGAGLTLILDGIDAGMASASKTRRRR